MTNPNTSIAQSATINGNSVKVMIVASDGSLDLKPLTSRELQSIAALDRALQSSSEFQERYPQARLQRVESMRGIPEHLAGRYYMLYSSAKVSIEFWGGVGQDRSIDFEQGLVSVSQKDLTY